MEKLYTVGIQVSCMLADQISTKEKNNKKMRALIAE